MAKGLPSGTVTFLFTDIEGSTRLVRDLGDAYSDLLDQHHRLGQLRAVCRDLLAQSTLQMLHRELMCRFVCGVHEVGHGLGLGQVELSIQICPLGELTRLGHSRVTAKTRVENAFEDDGPAVALKLHDILACVAMRAAHHHDERFVDHLAV